MPAKLRKMLGSAESPYILRLMRLMETQSKATLASWSMDYAERHILPIFEKHCPDDLRPQHTLAAARAWLRGEVKLPFVKNIILNECHAAARELSDNPTAQAAARTIGQASSVIHAPTHALGLVFYGAAAIAYDRLGTGESAAVYDAAAAEICAEMEAALRAVCVPNEPNPARLNWHC